MDRQNKDRRAMIESHHAPNFAAGKRTSEANRANELERSHPEAELEVSAERTLVVEAGGECGIGDGEAGEEAASRKVKAKLRDIGVRGQARAALEEADELELGEPEGSGGART
jgi:hypothetical protein